MPNSSPEDDDDVLTSRFESLLRSFLPQAGTAAIVYLSEIEIP
jgi:hypothetical protein